MSSHRKNQKSVDYEWQKFEEGENSNDEEQDRTAELSLYEAVQRQDVTATMNLLQDSKLQINWQNPESSNTTALHIAIEQDNQILVAMLIGRGADVSIKDSFGRTPLHIVIEKDNKQMLKLIAERTLSALEDAKEISSKSLKAIDTLSPNPKLKAKAKEPSSARSIEDIRNISNQLDKIFQAPIPTSKYETHFARESPVSAMMEITHFQTIYNIFVAVFILSGVQMSLNSYFEYGAFVDLELLVWNFTRIQDALLVWVAFFFMSFSALFLQIMIVNHALLPSIAYSLHFLLLFGWLFAVPKIVMGYQFAPATACIIGCEMVRLGMKMHSFLFVNKELREEKAKFPDSQDASVQQYPKNVNLESYLYFLFAPTLVYQVSYPRTKEIRLGFVLQCFFDVFLCTLFTYSILVRYCLPFKEDFCGTLQQLLMGVFHVMLPGTVISLLAFYMVLHSWLSGWAELTRFADRAFYADWWTSTSWATYYRKWNTVVHNFLHRHLFTYFKESMHMSKNSAMWLTFLISAVIHEYLIYVCLGFYKPILFLMFSIPGVLFIYLTRFMKYHRFWNVFMWAMLIIGHGFLIALYTRAWHLHYSGQANYDNWIYYVWVL